MIELSPARRSELRATAHHLKPVVGVAGNGLTQAVLGEIERSLQAHELIKIKIYGTERKARDELMRTLCDTLDAAPVQHIGTILVIWRKRREEEKTSVPARSTNSAAAPRAATAKSARAFAAAARRAALIKTASDKKRIAARRTRVHKPSGEK